VKGIPKDIAAADAVVTQVEQLKPGADSPQQLAARIESILNQQPSKFNSNLEHDQKVSLSEYLGSCLVTGRLRKPDTYLNLVSSVSSTIEIRAEALARVKQLTTSQKSVSASHGGHGAHDKAGSDPGDSIPAPSHKATTRP
jgi:hypothetical protein